MDKTSQVPTVKVNVLGGVPVFRVCMNGIWYNVELHWLEYMKLMED